jgi:hypothetical protein
MGFNNGHTEPLVIAAGVGVSLAIGLAVAWWFGLVSF